MKMYNVNIATKYHYLLAIAMYLLTFTLVKEKILAKIAGASKFSEH